MRSPAESTTARLAGDQRRESLLDAAASLIAAGGVDEVSMESVAERAGVSRPLVYKHFSNRAEMLAAVYRREASLLHEEMSRDVAAAATIEEMFRALVRGALRGSRARGPLFAALRSAGASSREVAREQRERDAITGRAFTRRACEELGLDARTARPVIGLLLAMIDAVVAQYRVSPTDTSAAKLERAYMTIVSSSLQALTRSS